MSADELLDGGAELPDLQAFYLDREYGDAVRDRAFEDYLRCWTVPGEPDGGARISRGTLRPHR